MLRLLASVLSVAGVGGTLWIAGSFLAGQWHVSFWLGVFAGFVPLWLSLQLPRPPDPIRPYVPRHLRHVWTAGSFYFLAGTLAAMAAVILWLSLKDEANLPPALGSMVFACSGLVIGLAALMAVSARKWAEQSAQEATR
jgi:hypothetical protein